MCRSRGRLDQKVVIVTGAASGIGRAMAEIFATEGAAIVAVDRDRAGLGALARSLEAADRPVLAIAADVTRAGDCSEAIERAIARFGKVDILCNNAGVIRRATVLETSEAEWDRQIEVNLKSVFLWSRAMLPHLIERGEGCILNTASGWGLRGGARAAAYCAAKGAVVQLTRAMAIDHGQQGIRVNCICPGDTDTPLLRSEAIDLGQDEGRFLEAARQRPLRRVAQPEEIARAALFLVSDDASHVTGATLVVDGGGLAGD